MRLLLQKYDIKVKYVPGKFQYIADTLSRACNESSMPSDSDMHKDMEYFIHNVVSSLPISDVKLKELRDLNSNDPTMKCYTNTLCRVGLLISVMYTHL